MWEPKTFEDQLLKRYLDDNPGKLYLEVSVSFMTELNKARRIDGVLIPGEEAIVYRQGSYSISQFRKDISGKTVHLIEAKRGLGRYVIGQIQVGESLLKHVFQPAEIVMVVLGGEGNPDIEWYCNNHNIKIAIYPIKGFEIPKNKRVAIKGRKDIRCLPDQNRYRAFLSGWTAAVNGKLYESIFSKKTHANMGNLFGWIYGKQPPELRKAIWEHYLIHAQQEWDEE
jgi:hypothetical protein